MPRRDQRIGDYILHEVIRVDGNYDFWNATKFWNKDAYSAPVTLCISVLPEGRREPGALAHWEVELDEREDYKPRPYNHKGGQLCPKCGGEDTRDLWDVFTKDGVYYGNYCRLCEYHFHLFSSTDAPMLCLDKSYGLPPTLLGLHFASGGRRLLRGEARPPTVVMPPNAGILFMSPDALIIVRLGEKFIRFWDVLSGKELPYTVDSPTPDCMLGCDPFLVFSPDGLSYALGHTRNRPSRERDKTESYSSKIELWGWADLDARRSKAPSLRWEQKWSSNLNPVVSAAAFSPNGRFLGVRIGKGISVCDVHSDSAPTELLKRFQWLERHVYYPRSLAWHFYFKGAREMIADRHGYHPDSVAWLDNSTLLGTHPEGGLIAWRKAEVSGGKSPSWIEERRWSNPCAPMARLVVGRGGSKFATLKGTTVSIWDSQTDTPPAVIDIPTSYVQDFALSCDDRFLVLAVSGSNFIEFENRSFLVCNLETATSKPPVFAEWKREAGYPRLGVHATVLGPLRIGEAETGLWLTLAETDRPRVFEGNVVH